MLAQEQKRGGATIDCGMTFVIYASAAVRLSPWTNLTHERPLKGGGVT